MELIVIYIAVVLVQDLEAPEQMYRKLGAKMVVGMPFKDQATSDTLYMAQIPPSSDKTGRRALKRLQATTAGYLFVLTAA